MDRIERLLHFGYLPSQLPRPFTTAGLGANYQKIIAVWDTLSPASGGKIPKSPPTKAEVFSVARAGHKRRATSIPNPVAQAYLRRAVVSNWASIIRYFRRAAKTPAYFPCSSYWQSEGRDMHPSKKIDRYYPHLGSARHHTTTRIKRPTRFGPCQNEPNRPFRPQIAPDPSPLFSLLATVDHS